VGVAHVDRLSEWRITSIGRSIKKRTTVEKGVDERYSVSGDGLLLELGGEWIEDSLEAKQGQEWDVNHERQRYGEDGKSMGRELNSGEGQ
jgi:hypothetical protein